MWPKLRLTLKVAAAITVASRAARRAPLWRTGLGRACDRLGNFRDEAWAVGLTNDKNAEAELIDRSASKARWWKSPMVGRFKLECLENPSTSRNR